VMAKITIRLQWLWFWGRVLAMKGRREREMGGL